MKKREFYVAYDYGMGGLWCIILARSAGDIKAKYPEFGVDETRPPWMDDQAYKDVRKLGIYDIDDKPSGYLKIMLKAARS